MKNKIIVGIIIAVLTLALISVVGAWWKESHKPAVSKIEYVQVPVIKEVEKIKTVSVPGPKQIVTIEKEKIVEKLKLPAWFSADKNEQAIAAGKIPAYEGDTNIIATLNTDTGVGKLIMKQEPLGIVGFANDKRLYAKAGYSTNQEAQITVGGEWHFIRVGSIKAGVFGEARAAFSVSTMDPGSRYPVEAVGGVILTY